MRRPRSWRIGVFVSITLAILLSTFAGAGRAQDTFSSGGTPSMGPGQARRCAEERLKHYGDEPFKQPSECPQPADSKASKRSKDFMAHDAAQLLEGVPYYRGRKPAPTRQQVQNTGHLLDIPRSERERQGGFCTTGPACFNWPTLRNGSPGLGAAFTDPAHLQPGDVAFIPLPNLHFAVYEGRDRYGNDIFSQIDGGSSPVQIVTRQYLERRAAA